VADEAQMVDSASDDRTANNTVRHQYRVLSEAEKAAMVAIKDKGEELLQLCGLHVAQKSPREAALARTKVEEAVMWAVKGLTA
jgi:energy-converting hydrogenase A subunit M